MKSLNVNNPIKYFPASNFESKEFQLQEKMNHLAKINLSKLSKEFLNDVLCDINQDRIKFIPLNDFILESIQCDEPIPKK